MDNGLLRVNFDKLNEASGDIKNALHELQTRLAEVESEGARLMETWDGAARAAYLDRQTRWQTAAADLTEILQRIQVAVSDSSSHYQDTERRATNRFQ